MVMGEAKTMEGIEIIPDGTVTTPQGFTAGGIHVGVRSDWTKLDVGIVLSEAPCATAAVYTQNRLKAAPLLVTMEHLKDGKSQAIVANSGCANVATGQEGMDNAVKMAQVAGQKLGLDPHDVIVASTGVIGWQLPIDKILGGIEKLEVKADGGQDFAVSIMTTDTVKKHMAVRYNGRTIGAACKGVGMIHPNMATMLCFITTDAAVEQKFLQKALKQAVDVSFNMVDIDSDTSTNDTATVMANGVAGGDPITEGHPDAEAFQGALTLLCTSMARMMVQDAEGGTKVIEANVQGAASPEDARLAAREIVRSLGVKTAMYGMDPNWGRILAAIGNSGAAFDLNSTTLTLVHPAGGEVALFADGAPLPYGADKAKECLEPSEITIHVNLGKGSGSATAWGSDLTEEFVKLNSLYTT